MSWREQRGFGYWSSCLCESCCCSVGSVLVCVRSGYCHVYIVSLVFLEYVLQLAGPVCWYSSHCIHGSGSVGPFGLVEFNRFCFGRLGRRNPVIPRVRESAEFSSSLNTLTFCSFYIFINCHFIFLLPHYSLIFSIILSCFPWSNISLFMEQLYSLFVLRF